MFPCPTHNRPLPLYQNGTTRIVDASFTIDRCPPFPSGEGRRSGLPLLRNARDAVQTNTLRKFVYPPFFLSLHPFCIYFRASSVLPVFTVHSVILAVRQVSVFSPFLLHHSKPQTVFLLSTTTLERAHRPPQSRSHSTSSQECSTPPPPVMAYPQRAAISSWKLPPALPSSPPSSRAWRVILEMYCSPPRIRGRRRRPNHHRAWGFQKSYRNCTKQRALGDFSQAFRLDLCTSVPSSRRS